LAEPDEVQQMHKHPRQIWLDDHTASARPLGPQHAGERLRLHTGRPDHRRRLDALAVHEHKRVLLHLGDLLAESDVHAALRSALRAYFCDLA
jgi:hypothetical protein